jgi:hypothetical protein
MIRPRSDGSGVGGEQTDRSGNEWTDDTGRRGRERRRAWVTEAGSLGAGVVVQANTACPRGPGLLAPRAIGCRRTDSPLGGYRYSAFPDRGVGHYFERRHRFAPYV